MKTTLEMAREAGADTLMYWDIEKLKRFEALVRADEREALCKAMEDQNTWNWDDPADTAIQVIRARGNT